MHYSDDGEFSGVFGTPGTADSTPMAYVKPVLTEQGQAYGVYSADGTQLALFGTFDAAFFAAKQHDLEPVLLH